MSKVTTLQFQAEAPAWMAPLAALIADVVRTELQANTREMAALRAQVTDLVEVQLQFLESVRSQSEK